jgi:hypothetical protein
LSLVNLATPPVTAEEVARECFGVSFTNETEASPVAYDMRTLHAARLGGTPPYLMSARQSLDAIAQFVADERTGAT